MSDNKKIKPLTINNKLLDKLPKAHQKELQSLINDIAKEANKVREEYEQNKSEISGSQIHVHENSPALDSDENGEPTYSGSRWRHVLKSF